MALVESLKILLPKAGWNDNSGGPSGAVPSSVESWSLEVPVCPGHSGSMPPLVWATPAE